MGTRSFPEFGPETQQIVPPGAEQSPPGPEITPPGPEFTPLGEEFTPERQGTSKPPVRKRSKRYAAAFLALLGLFAAGKGLTTQSQQPLPTEPPTPTQLATAPPLTRPTEPETEPPTEPEVLGPIHLMVLPGYLDPEQEREAVLLDETYAGAEFVRAAIPQPEPQTGYRFLGYALVHRDMKEDWVNRSISDELRRADVADCKPDETGTIQIRLRGVWTAEDREPPFLPLTLDAGGGEGTAQYDAAGPMLSGTTVYLAAYPAPTRPGWRFTGWYREPEGGEPVRWLQASEFYGQTGGETDWREQIPITLYAHWEPEA